MRGLSEHSIIIRGGSLRPTGGVFASPGDRGARGGVENDDFGVLFGFPATPGAENAISALVPTSPGSLQCRLARFSDGNATFFYSLFSVLGRAGHFRAIPRVAGFGATRLPGRGRRLRSHPPTCGRHGKGPSVSREGELGVSARSVG